MFGAVAAIAHLEGDEIVYAPARYRQLEIWGVDGASRRIIRWSGRDRAVRSRDKMIADVATCSIYGARRTNVLEIVKYSHAWAEVDEPVGTGSRRSHCRDNGR